MFMTADKQKSHHSNSQGFVGCDMKHTIRVNQATEQSQCRAEVSILIDFIDEVKKCSIKP